MAFPEWYGIKTRTFEQASGHIDCTRPGIIGISRNKKIPVGYAIPTGFLQRKGVVLCPGETERSVWPPSVVGIRPWRRIHDEARVEPVIALRASFSSDVHEDENEHTEHKIMWFPEKNKTSNIVPRKI